MSAPTLTLVIPAYNEAQRLPRLLEVLDTHAAEDIARAGLELREAIVVDDGSTDATARLLREAAATRPLLRPLVDGAGNRGKGHAVARGVREATGDLVLLTDLDLAAPLSEVVKLEARREIGADVAVGSRALESEGVWTPAHRRLVGRTFNLLVRAATGLRIRDTQCGFKLLSAGTARTLLAEQLVEGYAFDVELLMRAQLAGLRLAEVPVAYQHDEDTRVSVLDASAAMARDVARLVWALRVRRLVRPTRD